MKKSTKKVKNVKNNKNCWIIIGGVFVVVIGLIIYKNHLNQDYYKIVKREKAITETTIFDTPASAWVRVQGTNIDTPVIASNYVTEDNTEDFLWLASGYVEGNNRRVIYGHNLRNVSREPEINNSQHIRFEQLMGFIYPDFAKKNLYIQYSDGKEEALYKIYAVAFYDISEEYGQSYPHEEVPEYIEKTRDNSIYDYDIDVNQDDTLISLITCTRYFGAIDNTQFKIDARKVRENEKIDQYKVETNSNYDIIK